MKRILALALVLLTSLLVSCNGGGSGGGGGAGSPGSQPSSTALVTAVDTRAAAKAIYDQVDSGDGFTQDDISSIFAAFAIPTVASTDGTKFKANLDAGTPELLDFQAASIAKRMSGPSLVPITDFIAMLNTKGATQAGSSAPLTKDYLDKQFAPFVVQQSFQADELIPAFVLALGRERAARSPGGVTDVVWGDGYLDPLQVNLLLYNMAYVANVPSEASGIIAAGLDLTKIIKLSDKLTPTLGPRLAKMAKDYPKDFITGKIAKLIQFPIGRDDSAKVSLCASIVLYSYNLSLSDDPAIISEREPDNLSVPYKSDISAHLIFDFQQDTHSFSKQLATWIAGCHIPSKGYAPNKPITWKLTQGLPDHGSFIHKDPATDTIGDANATYQANDTKLPAVLRDFRYKKDVRGLILVKAGNLLPGWNSFANIVRWIKLADLSNKMGAASTVLTVQYYDPPPLKFSFTSDLGQSLGNGDGWEAIVSGSTPLSLVKVGSELHYKGTGTIHYDSFSFNAPGCRVSATTKDGKFAVDIPVKTTDGSLNLYFVPAPLTGVSGTMTCNNGIVSFPPAGYAPSPFWGAGWVVNHESEMTSQGYRITNWKGTTFQSSVVKDYHSSGTVHESSELKLELNK